MLNFTRLFIVLVGLAGFSTTALSHSRVNATSPEDGAVLTEIPASIDLNFSANIRLTKVTLQLATEEPVALDLSGHKGFENSFSLPNTSERSGLYTIEWRGLGVDGHTMRGAFSFTVE